MDEVFLMLSFWFYCQCPKMLPRDYIRLGLLSFTSRSHREGSFVMSVLELNYYQDFNISDAQILDFLDGHAHRHNDNQIRPMRGRILRPIATRLV